MLLGKDSRNNNILEYSTEEVDGRVTLSVWLVLTLKNAKQFINDNEDYQAIFLSTRPPHSPVYLLILSAFQFLMFVLFDHHLLVY